MKKLLLVLLVLAFAGTVQASNPLVDLSINNPDFEGGWVDQGWGVPFPPGVPAGWSSWEGSDVGALADIAGNPGRALELSVHAGQAAGGYAFVWNNKKALAYQGMILTVSADVIDLAPSGYDFAAFSLEAFDAGGGSLGKLEQKIAGVTASWANYSMNYLAPTGTTQVEVKLVASTDNPLVPNVGCAYGFDNVVLTPEPITIALLGLGGLFLRRRK